MFIKLKTIQYNDLLLDVERIISVKEEPTEETLVKYAEPEGSGQKLIYWRVKETADEILEKLQDAGEGLYE